MSSLIWADGLSFDSTKESFEVSVPNGDVRGDSVSIGVDPSQEMQQLQQGLIFTTGQTLHNTIYALEQSGCSEGGFVLRGPFCEKARKNRPGVLHTGIRGDVIHVGLTEPRAQIDFITLSSRGIISWSSPFLIFVVCGPSEKS